MNKNSTISPKGKVSFAWLDLSGTGLTLFVTLVAQLRPVDCSVLPTLKRKGTILWEKPV
jgi:hypothetical protein